MTPSRIDASDQYSGRSLVMQTPALIVATIALFLTLGGAAYAVSQPSGAARTSPPITFHALTLKNGWRSEQATFGSGSPSIAIANDVVYLSGSLAQPTTGSDEFAVLPSAYRPAHNLYITVYTNGDTSGTLYIGTNGVAEAYSGASCGGENTAQCFTDLATVSFPKSS